MGNKTHAVRKRSQRDYSLGFKLSVIEQIEKGEMTYKQAQSRYGIQGRSTVLVWLRKHGKLDWSRPCELPMKPSKETPAQQIKRLEKELEDERLRSLILNEMVDIIDNDYGGNIRKKLLPKALKNSNLQEK
jgi:transposase-like protein